MKLDVETLVQQWRQREQKLLDQLEDRYKRQVEMIDLRERRFREKLTWARTLLKGERKPTRLHHWFLRDTWKVSEGLVLLCGFDPDGIRFDNAGSILPPIQSDVEKRLGTPESRSPLVLLAGIDVNNEAVSSILGEVRVFTHKFDFEKKYSSLLKLWKSGDHDKARYVPRYFIDWAVSKGQEIDWLGWATEEGYYADSDKPETAERPLAPRERRSLLIIIAALCDYSDIKHQERGAASQIARLTEEIGATVTNDTIRKALNQIPDALETRMK